MEQVYFLKAREDNLNFCVQKLPV